MKLKKLLIIIFMAIIPACNAVPKLILGTSTNTALSPLPSESPGVVNFTPIPSVYSSPTPVNSGVIKPDKSILNITIYRITENGKKILMQSSFGSLQNNFRYILAGKTEKIFAEITYNDWTKSSDVEFISRNPDILLVDKNGLVQAKSPLGSNFDVGITARSIENKNIFISIIYKVLSRLPDTATISGKVFDSNNNPVKEAKVKALDIENNEWNSDEILTNSDGEFYIQNVPPETKLTLSVEKDGFTSVSRVITAKLPNLNEINNNIFNFGGNNADEIIYAIQNEPVITGVKINDTKVNLPGAGNREIIIPDNDIITPNNNFEPNVKIELTFSEAVRKDLLENVFRLVSQKFSVLDNDNFTLSKETGLLRFEWLNDKTVLISTVNELLQLSNNEARYQIEFSGPFKDLSGFDAILGKYIRFNQDVFQDYVIFSVTPDNQSLQLTSTAALNGTGSEKDKIVLKFNEPLEIIGNSSYSLLLTNKEYPDGGSSQSIVKITNNITSENNVTLLGFHPSGSQKFNFTYAIGKLDKNKKILVPLNGINDNDTFDVTVDLKTVTLEFDTNVFAVSDIIAFSLGSGISGIHLIDNISYDLSTIINYPYAEINDPAGNQLSDTDLMIITVR